MKKMSRVFYETWKVNSRTFQEQILKNSLFQGSFKNHSQFKSNSKNSRNSRTAGHPVFPFFPHFPDSKGQIELE